MQHEVTVVQKLLDQQGYVVTPGWARRPVWQYNRENIAAPSFPNQGVGLLYGGGRTLCRRIYFV